MKQYISTKLLQTAKELRDRVIALRPFPEETLKSLRENYRIGLTLALIRGEYTVALIPAILRHEYVQSLEMSHKNPAVFVDFITERIIVTQMDLLRLLNDGGVNGGVNGGENEKRGGVKSNNKNRNIMHIKQKMGIFRRNAHFYKIFFCMKDNDSSGQ